MDDKRTSIFYDEGFQPLAPPQCGEMFACAITFIFPQIQYDMG